MTVRHKPVGIGNVFARLTVLELHSASGKKQWKCLCSCGMPYIALDFQLKNGRAKSCGCLRNELNRKRFVRHGKAGTPEYISWQQIKSRCYNKSSKFYKDYGLRGVVVCDEWRGSFEKFFEYVGPRPTPRHSIDRIKNDGNYEPGNVRWATKKEQANNRRSNRVLEFNGLSKTLSEWASHLNVRPGLIAVRLHRGWSIERALTV